MACCCVAAAAACGGGESSAPAAVALGLHAAVAEGDGDAACGLLAPATLQLLEAEEDADCAQAILDVGLPLAGGDSASDVFSGQARVVLEADTVFLAELEDGWRVVAVGCQARGDSPYQCTVEGP